MLEDKSTSQAQNVDNPGQNTALIADKRLLATHRADICSRCLYNRGVQLDGPGPLSYTVDCKRVANNRVSLIEGSCRALRWETVNPNRPVFNRSLRLANGRLRPVPFRDYFHAIYVISLQRTPERLTRFWETFPADWPFEKPQVFDAVDADETWPWEGWKGGGGAYGCWRSWMTILAKYLSELPRLAPMDRRPILIMEDDCEFSPGLQARFREFIEALPPDWEVAFPGGQHFRPTIPFAPGVARCRETGRTHCVMINAAFVPELYGFWLRWDSHVDHALQHWCKNDVNRRFFAADPFFAIQGSNWSTIRWRQEPARSWDSRVPALTRMPANVKIVLLTESLQAVQQLRDETIVHTGYWRDENDVDRGLVGLMSKPPEVRAVEFRKWIDTLRTEAAAFPNAVLGVWWPERTAELRVLLEDAALEFFTGLDRSVRSPHPSG